ncbi:ribose-5-phosphate isomerase B [Pedobacter glucosidilyticus]|jgi:ribose 5-phosphate isomerase B|uniref:Ribose 5-phosphate isomerase B n=1 Tax=Pedobacter aquae TaxID=2605747 RepID=A0A5C0VKW8_9SPHI|nr:MULTISPECIES: ribose 5-phosphate isomerase B [Pedobacter]KHJ37320.1 ribose-5-phosphate isomerase B [Pedobacter glucosidilyticus]QEK52779.1 ribose 5-phosphate isomerase B [Pedobacter aquae]
MKIAIGADHAGFNYKGQIIPYLNSLPQITEVKDFGTYSSDSTDYPDFAHPTANAVESGAYDLGILICGSANGVAITANKHQGIRAAICWEVELAKLARAHNNANIVCIPERFISIDLAKQIIDAFLATEFEGGRHANRVGKISC